MNIRLTAALMLASLATAASAATDIVMHRDPGCGCCMAWVAQMKASFGGKVQVIDDAQRATFQRKAGVPAQLASCHTAIVGGYVIEGHVPANDIKRLIATKPKGVRGLAAPGMPMGSPGMEVAGVAAQPFDVIAFGPGGRRIFAHHG